MADHLERIGQVMGDYRLVRWLGGGGFGNVYLALHMHDDEQVALKVLEIRLAKSEDFRAFLNEASAMRLRHPHILPLLNFGLSREDTPFLVMEYAPLGTLRDRHPKGSRVPLSTVVEYATQVASALSYAHTRRVVHRDVKPENMLVRADGVILLSDFGIATTAHSTHSLSANQGIGGTIPYMAPEQLEGQPRTETDQYALGIVIYEWLAGRCPFRGTAVEVAMQHAMKLPSSLVKQVPGLPQEVEEVLFKALAKTPRDRFASMQAFLQALEDASYYLPPLHRLSDESFPKEVSSGAPPPATLPPVADPPTRLPSSGALEPTVFSPHRKQSITRAANPEPEPATKTKRALPVTGQVRQTLPTTKPPRQRAPLTVRGRAPSKRQMVILLVIVLLLVAVIVGSHAYSTTVSAPHVQATTGSSTAYSSPTSRSTPDGIIIEFSIPTANSSPNNLVVGPDGNLWFTEEYGNKIGRISPSGTITEFPIPTANSSPLGPTTVRPSGNLWFIEGSGNKIGRITPDGIITEFPIPTANSFPNDLIVGPDGNLWFTEGGGNKIGRISPTGIITEFPLPTFDSSPTGLTVGPDDNLWFLDTTSGGPTYGGLGRNIGRISPTGTLTEFFIRAPGFLGPTGSFLMIVGPDGNLWFTEHGWDYIDKIGRITPGGTITEFALPTVSDIKGIVAGPDGNLWFTEEYGNKIGRITPGDIITGGIITEFPLPTTYMSPIGIVVGPDGDLWFAEDGGKIGRITLNGTITEFPLPTPGSGPNWIVVGPDGNLWFTEDGGNKIGRITSGK